MLQLHKTDIQFMFPDHLWIFPRSYGLLTEDPSVTGKFHAPKYLWRHDVTIFSVKVGGNCPSTVPLFALGSVNIFTRQGKKERRATVYFAIMTQNLLILALSLIFFSLEAAEIRYCDSGENICWDNAMFIGWEAVMNCGSDLLLC